MKTKILKLAVILLVLTGSFSCGKDDVEYEIYEKHDISACGVIDPLKNIEWLAQFCDEHDNDYFIEIFLYKNKITDENHIVIETATKFKEGMSPSPIYTTSVYSCDGEKLLFNGTESPIPVGWEEFFEENELIIRIWAVKAK
ncbi:MAG: hypothetical protein LBT56_06090 [Prevotellaceae bacterium]|jgi:hypothetical protein|nr:hypothetical protein [Prevotellaceae bacterium]